MEEVDIQGIVRRAIEEFVSQEQVKNEPAHKAELQEERRRREQLERKLNEVIAENQRNRQIAAGSRTQFGGEERTAAAGGGQDRSGVQGGAGSRASGPRTGGWWREGKRARCRCGSI